MAAISAISGGSLLVVSPDPRVPPASLTVSDVKTLVGARRQVDVMDLHTQETHTMTMHHWAKYYESRPRHKILNVISLEFSRTKLDPLVQPPTLVGREHV